jgi:hypothetical protein
MSDKALCRCEAFALGLSIVLGMNIGTVDYIYASDALYHCASLPDGLPKIEFCLSAVARAEPNALSGLYWNISDAYWAIKDIDHAIQFAEKAATASDQRRPPEPSLTPYSHGFTYKDILSAFYEAKSLGYERLAKLEELKALQLDVYDKDLVGAANYDTKALLHATKAIVIFSSNYEAYAIRARINARFCKSNESRDDVRRAIELAVHARNLKAVEEYNDIETDNCSENHRGRLD